MAISFIIRLSQRSNSPLRVRGELPTPGIKEWHWYEKSSDPFSFFRIQTTTKSRAPFNWSIWPSKLRRRPSIPSSQELPTNLGFLSMEWYSVTSIPVESRRCLAALSKSAQKESFHYSIRVLEKWKSINWSRKMNGMRRKRNGKDKDNEDSDTIKQMRQII